MVTNQRESVHVGQQRSGSIEWGEELFAGLAVPSGALEVKDIGAAVEARTVAHLRSVRPDLDFAGSRHATFFEQYYHLKVFKEFNKAYKGPSAELIASLESWQGRRGLDRELRSLLSRLKRDAIRAQKDHALVEELRATVPEESLLRLDVAVSRPSEAAATRLLVGISLKWSLRTDRAQDCISQGAKLVNLRRGHMPHYGVLTMEPRPAMLRLFAYGSGAVDCVYHLALPELREAAERMERQRDRGPWGPRTDLERMVRQGRVRDYDALVEEVVSLPVLNLTSDWGHRGVDRQQRRSGDSPASVLLGSSRATLSVRIDSVRADSGPRP